jgi:hypothetical protein
MDDFFLGGAYVGWVGWACGGEVRWKMVGMLVDCGMGCEVYGGVGVWAEVWRWLQVQWVWE